MDKTTPLIYERIKSRPSRAIELMHEGVTQVLAGKMGNYSLEICRVRTDVYAYREPERNSRDYGLLQGCVATWAVQALLGRPFSACEFGREGPGTARIAVPEGWDVRDTWEFTEALDCVRRGAVVPLFKYCDRGVGESISMEMWNTGHAIIQAELTSRLPRLVEIARWLKFQGL